MLIIKCRLNNVKVNLALFHFLKVVSCYIHINIKKYIYNNNGKILTKTIYFFII